LAVLGTQKKFGELKESVQNLMNMRVTLKQNIQAASIAINSQINQVKQALPTQSQGL